MSRIGDIAWAGAVAGAAFGGLLWVTSYDGSNLEEPRVVECRVYPQATSDRYGSFYDFVVEQPCDADAGDRLDIVLHVSNLSDRIAEDWSRWCMDSAGELRASPATGDSICRDVDF